MKLLSTLIALILTFSFVQANSQNLCDNNEVILTLETGNWAAEIDFAVYDANGDSLFVFSNVGFALEDNMVYSAVVCLDDGCYTLEMYDSFGDGWNGAELTVSYGETMIPLGGLDAGNVGMVTFGVNTEDCTTILPGCTDPEANNFEPWATEDDGSCEYDFACETGVEAQMYVCTFANGTEVSITVLDEDGNIVLSVENQTSPIVYYDFCMEEGVCYTIEMANSEGNNGWYNGYFWVNAGNEQIVNDALDPNSSFDVTTMSIDGSCPVYGCTDSEALNYDYYADIDDGSCEYPEECDANLVFATTFGGTFPGEIAWFLTDGNGNVVLAGPGSLEDNNISQQYTCIEDGCYTLTMMDDFGDGWNGAFVEFYMDGQLLASGTFEDGDQSFLTISINSECDDLVGGCTNPDALNYNPDADFDDGSCEYPIYGCTDPLASNFNSWANTDDGSCVYPLECEEGVLATVYVCTFSNGQNVSLEFVDDNNNVVFEANDLNSGQIAYFEMCLDTTTCYTVNMSNTGGQTGWYGGYYWVNVDGYIISQDQLDNNLTNEVTNFSISDTCPTLGCTDPSAANYDPAADEDDGSCEYIEPCEANSIQVNVYGGAFGGEMSIGVVNEEGIQVWYGDGYSSQDFSTEYICLEDGCYTVFMYDSFGDGWNNGFFEMYADSSLVAGGTFYSGDLAAVSMSLNTEGCDEIINGCTDPEALNYNPEASFDDGSCQYPILGCTDQSALNYNPQATEDDGSCIYPIECGEGEVLAELYVCTFSNGGEVVLEIVDENGNQVILVDSLNNGQIVYFDLCLDPDMCYTVNMSNSAGNTGWYNGYYWINTNGVQISTDYLDQSLTNESTNFSINGNCPTIGCTDQDALNYDPTAEEDDGSCIYLEPCDFNAVMVTIGTGSWGNEISWQILDSDSNAVAWGGNYYDNQLIVSGYCLEDGCYTLEMFDSFGDGWNGGDITIALPDGSIMTYTISSGTYNSATFGINSDCIDGIYGCTNPEAINYNWYATIDDGSCYFEDEPCDGASVVIDLYTIDYGFEINWVVYNSEGGVEINGNGGLPDSLIVNTICLEDGCYVLEINDLFGQGGLGGEISLTFEDGTSLSVDLAGIGLSTIPFGINSDCGIDVEIAGCTDPEALNYNWLATVDDGSCFYPGPYLGPSYALTGEDVTVEFNFAPNPAENVILLTFDKIDPTQRLNVDIFDAVGRLVLARDFGNTQEFFNTNINVESLANGAYVIVATNGASRVTKQLIKQ